MDYTTHTDYTNTQKQESGLSSSTYMQSQSKSKLYLAENSLFGRATETIAFRRVVDRVRKSQSQPEFLLVHGNSGCGKTALIRYIQKEVSSFDNDMIWVDGKYDQFDHGSRPFGAIAEATSDLLHKLRQSEIDAVLESIDHIDVFLLEKVLNCFGVLLPDQNVEHSTEVVNEHALTTFSRFYARFLTLVCSSQTVVMVLDDLQWCDSASRKLLVSVANDRSLHNFLLVGGRRDDDGRSFELPTITQMTVRRINLFPLDVTGTKELVAAAVGAPLDDAAELAAILYSKTDGNPYFVVQTLVNLVQNGTLKRNAAGEFSWKISRVMEKTNVGDNVLKLLLRRIEELPRTTQAVLFVAAQWGFRFRIGHVEAAFKCRRFLELFDFNEDQVDVTKAMAKAIVCGLVEKSRHGTYRFTHDRLQQSAIALVTSRETEEHFNSIMEHFGLLLFHMTQTTKRDNDPILFTALRVLQSHQSIPCAEMAKLCSTGAMVSARKAAFEQALNYGKAGINFLKGTKEGSCHWMENYGTSLDLFSLSAELHFVAGNIELSKARIACVAEHVIDARHTIRTQTVTLDMLAREGRWLDCTAAGTKFLRHYGINVDPNSGLMALAWNLIKAKSLFAGRSAKELKSLPKIRDPDMVHVTKQLGKIAASSWVSQKDETCVVAILQMVRVALTHGVSPEAAYAFAAYGGVVALVQGDHEAAWDFADLSIELAEKRGFERARPMISYSVTMYLGFHQRGITWSIPWLRKAIEAGIRSGEIMFVATSFWALGSLLLYTTPLPERKQFTRLGQHFFVEYKQDSWFELFRLWAQLSETLETGGVSLNGTYFRVDDFLSRWSRDDYQPHSQEAKVVNAVHYTNVFLFTILCEYDRLLQEDTKYQGSFEFGRFLPKISIFFHLALSFFAVGRERANKKYKHKAIRYATRVRELTSGTSPFLHGMNSLLAAEEESLKSTTTDIVGVLGMYTNAAKLFEEDGCTLYCAMTFEKAGDFLLRNGYDERGNKFLLEAYELFSDFGVASKLPILRRKYQAVPFRTRNLHCLREDETTHFATDRGEQDSLLTKKSSWGIERTGI